MKRGTRNLFVKLFAACVAARVRPLFALVLVTSVFNQGCFDEEKGEPFYGRVVVPQTQELRWSDGGLPRVFDPAVAASPPDTDAVRAIFEGLTDYDPRTLEPVPAVALRWESDEGGRVWTFHLRPDSRWTNGDHVTAQDFVRSWKRTLQLGSRAPHSGLLSNIEGAREIASTPMQSREQPRAENTPAEPSEQSSETVAPTPAPAVFGASAVDERTLRVRLVHPDENFPALASHPVFRPVHELGAHTDIITPPRTATGVGEELEATLISNGAFRLSRRAGNGVVLERAETYWDASRIALERVHFVASTDAEDALAAYRAGEVDAITNAAFEPLALKLLAPYEDFHRETYGALTFYQFNTARAPFADRKVREAFALALDIERLSADVMGGATIPAKKFIPVPEGAEREGVAGDKKEAGRAELAFDPARAKALLAEAGYPEGKDFPVVRLLVNRNEQQRLLANAVAGMWRTALNVRTEVITKDWDEYEAALSAGEYDVARRSVVMQTLNEETNMLAIFGETAAPPRDSKPSLATDENGREETDKTDDKELSSVELDQTRVRRVMTEEEALRELPAIPIYFAASFSLVKPYVEGFHTNLLDAPSLKHVRVDRAWTPPPPESGGGTGGL